MKSNPLVSVLIPCYNVESYVDRAVQSILKQSYSNLEVWIIDDASTDNTLQKIYEIKDDRVKVVAYENNTQKVGAVNEILQKVTGDLIAFQDADDWSEPTRFEKQSNEFIKDAELGVCFTKYEYSGEINERPAKIALTDEELRDEFLHFGNKKNVDMDATVCPTMMISKRALEKTGGYHSYFKGRVAEDIHWVYRILKAFKGITINESLYHYTVRKDSLTGFQFAGKNAKAAYSWALLREIISKDHIEGIDVLLPEYAAELKELELKACEDALIKSIQERNNCVLTYENSTTFKLGKALLTPLRILKTGRKR